MEYKLLNNKFRIYGEGFSKIPDVTDAADETIIPLERGYTQSENKTDEGDK